MAALPRLLLLASIAAATAVAAAASAAQPLNIDVTAKADEFMGIGGLSGGGATSVLLKDYPEKQRDDILDYLFKPQYGASLHTIKVEIGGDSASTDGTESSHMHSEDDLDYHRGYEWWLLSEAKKRNPDIQTYGLPWAFPGWVGGPEQSGSPFSHPNLTSTYIVKWLEGAKSVYGIDIDFIGVWNERASNATYAETLRQVLDDAGFEHTKLVAKDGAADICDSLSKDEDYAKVVDIVGLHYPSDYKDYSTCHGLHKPVWASEESSSYDDLNGAACWARVITSHYALNRMTSSIMWNLVGSYYHGTNWYASSLLTAVQPWSGYYESDMPVVWATAHVTQFSQPGWFYLANGRGTGQLPQGGFYASLVSDDGKDFTLTIVKISRDHASCTRPPLPDFDVADETITFSFGGNSPERPLHVWYSNFESETPVLFENRGTVPVSSGGTFSLNVSVGSFITVSTVASAKKGVAPNPVPSSHPCMPLPYSDDFESYVDSSEARYFADQIGAFEIHNDTLDPLSNHVMLQMVPELPIGWSDHGSNGPMTLIGSREWQDISVSVRFTLPSTAPTNASGCVGTRSDQMWDNGIIFCVAANGTWILSVGGPNIGGNYDASQIIKTGNLHAAPGLNKWHVISITTVGQRASGIFDDASVFSNIPIRDVDTGFAVFGTNQWLSAQFDDFSVSEAGNHTHPASSGEFHAGTQVGLADCAANCRVLPSQVFELRSNWQLHHVPSGLCVEADSAKAGASLTLQPCVHGKTTQQFRNDYTNIRNRLEPVTLGSYKTLASKLALVPSHGSGSSATLADSKGASAAAWSTWSYFPNTNQLRNQYVAIPDLGYPQCLTAMP